MEREDVAAGRERGRSAVLVALAAGASAAVSYVVMWLAAHALSTVEATVYLTFLSVLFFSYGLLSGLATEVTRSTAAALRDARAVGPSLWRVAAVVGAACSVVVVTFVVVCRQRLLGSDVSSAGAWAVALLLGLGVAAYAFHSTVVGALTGRRQWSGSATVIGAEASTRLVLTVLAVLLGGGLLAMVAGSALAALAVLAVLALASSIRRAMSTATDCPGRALGWRIAQSMLAQAAAAAVIVGFPVMLAATTTPSDYRHAAPLILAISLTRAPLLVPLNAVQGVAVSYLVHAGRRFGRALIVVLGVVTAVGLVGSLLAWAIGPWLMATLFGVDYRVDGWVLGLLTLSATLLAILTVTGATCQATNRHAVFLGGWVVATVTTALLLLLPGSLAQRSVTALLVGPAAGLAVHVASLVLGIAGDRTVEKGRVRVDV
jgi:O-antigen/teichoic acid export membrane protein